MYRLFLTPDWLALRTQGVLPSLFLPDFGLSTVKILLSLLCHGEAVAWGQGFGELKELVLILGVKLVRVNDALIC